MNDDPVLSLPWRQPFLMIDRMIECIPGRRIVTVKAITGEDGMVRGYDAGGLFPGALVLEGMSQSAALLFLLTYPELAPYYRGDPVGGGRREGGPVGKDGRRLPMLGLLKARIRDLARPGDSIVYRVASMKMLRGSGMFRGVARVDGRTIAEAEMSFASVRAPAPDPLERP